jgi:hypothetical protein
METQSLYRAWEKGTNLGGVHQRWLEGTLLVCDATIVREPVLRILAGVLSVEPPLTTRRDPVLEVGGE